MEIGYSLINAHFLEFVNETVDVSSVTLVALIPLLLNDVLTTDRRDHFNLTVSLFEQLFHLSLKLSHQTL